MVDLDWFWSICSAIVPTSEPFPSVAIALFVVAFLGGFMHCSFMCGPFVMAQVTTRLEKTPVSQMNELTRLKGAALFPYHFGRITTYTLLGGIVSIFSQGISMVWQTFSPVLLLGAGVLMVLSVIRPASGRISFFGGNALAGLSRQFSKYIKPLMRSPFGMKGYFLGLILGFLPCSMLYAALAAAAATGNFWQGSVSMAAFALGTVLPLFTVALLGTLLANNLRQRLRPFAKLSMGLAGCWLCVIALTQLM